MRDLTLDPIPERDVPDERLNDDELEALAGEVESHYNRDQDIKRQHSLIWEENLRYLEGVPEMSAANSVSRSSGDIFRVGGGRRAHPPRTNFLYRAFRVLVSNLISNFPKGSVRPQSVEDVDKVATRTANAVREVLWEETKERSKYRSVAVWMVATGAAIKKDYLDYSWDRRMDIHPVDEGLKTAEGVELLDDEGEPLQAETAETQIPEMRIASTVVSPFQFAFDPLADDLDSAEWVMEYSVRTISWIQEQFGGRDAAGKLKPGYTGRADEVKPEKDLRSTLLSWARLKGTQRGAYSTTDLNFDDSAVVKEYYRRPSEKFPDARCVVVANHVPLFAGKGPYMPYRWHPYTLFSFVKFPGRMWPLSAMEMGVPVQKKINSIDFFWQHYRWTSLAPKLLVPKGSGIPRDHLSGMPGQILDYNAAAGTPVQVSLPPVGGEIVMERDRAVQDLDSILGTNDPISGERAKGVPSFQGQALLMESGQRSHTLTHADWEDGIAASETFRLQLVQLAVKEDRPEFTRRIKQKLESDASDTEFRTFIGSDLRDNVQVAIEPGSSQPQSKELFKERVKEFLQSGILSHIFQDPQMRLQFFELFGLERFATEDSIDVTKAEAENALARTNYDLGKLIIQQDVHELHLKIHSKRVKQILKDGQPQQGSKLFPEFMLLIQHISDHQRILQEQMMQQQMQMAQQGQPPMGGPPQQGQAGRAGGPPQPPGPQSPGQQAQRPSLPQQGGQTGGQGPFPQAVGGMVG